jgi:hypothetical protein
MVITIIMGHECKRGNLWGRVSRRGRRKGRMLRVKRI